MNGVVDLRPVKAGAQRYLPAGHPLREAILAGPDELPRDSALPTLEAYVRMAWAGRTSFASKLYLR
jgi:hypothetical protein